MGLHCPVEVGSPSSRAGSTLKAYPRAGTPSWPLRTYGHVHEKQGKCVPHDVSENVWILRRAVARPAAWNRVWQCCNCLAPGWGVSGLVGSGSHHCSGLCLVQLHHPLAKWLTQTLRSEHRPRLQRWVSCTHGAYIKSNARGRGWRPAVGLGGAISEKGDANWPEHFRGAAGAFYHCISTAPPPPTAGVWPMMPIRGGLVV